MIYLYTSRFPYGQMSESFLAVELAIASQLGKKVTIIPTQDDAVKRQLPENVSVDRALCRMGVGLRIKSMLSVFLPGRLSLWKALRDVDFSWKYLSDAVKYLYGAHLVYEDMKQKTALEELSMFYSYWLSYAPLAFSEYHQKYPHTQHRFISRGHGSDVYSTSVGVYYPLRKFLLQGIDQVYVVSEYGKTFLQQKYPEFSDKIKLSRLGVIRPSVSPKKAISEARCVVSCASVIGLKRIDLLHSSLMAYADATDTMIEWHHFGGGALFVELKKRCEQTTSPRLKCILHGMVDNKVIRDFYANQQVDCLISVSSTEGIPVSMMEAISFGIPVLSTDVGGCKEIVTAQTGLLIPKDFSQEEFEESLTAILNNSPQLSKTAEEFYDENYNAERNYTEFYRQEDY